MTGKPRVLVTGFSVFPGAPVNPTEWLIGRLRSDPPADGLSAFRADVLAVEYEGMGERLSAIGQAFSPDIAIHFGLARRASGFRLERIARNSLKDARPDNRGRLPNEAAICKAPDTLSSSLPLAHIAESLERAGLPVEHSEDAGGYLCNMVFMLSRAHACEGLRPAMAGFVHVPAFSEDAAPGDPTISPADLERGARLIIAACLDRFGEAAAPATRSR